MSLRMYGEKIFSKVCMKLLCDCIYFPGVKQYSPKIENIEITWSIAFFYKPLYHTYTPDNLFIEKLVMLDNLVNVIHGIVQKYESVDVSQLRKLGTISIKMAKAQLDIRFLNNCKLYNVIPRFICFNLPGTNETDSRFIRKCLIRSALKK